MQTMISVRNVAKEYSRPREFTGPFHRVRSLVTTQRVITPAVRDISFDIERGEMVGYLGANGAGKSTTIKMLTGVLVPTSGSIEVNGLVPWRDRRRNARNIGVVFGHRSQLWYDLPLQQSFELVAKLYGLDTADFRTRLGELVEILDMEDFLETPVRSLSLGQRLRGDFAAAMLHGPALLFLDEPTVGLDVVAKARIREFVAETNASARTTIVLTSHDLDDIQRLCERVIIIDRGSVLYDGGLSALTRRYAPYRELVLSTPAHAPEDFGRFGAAIVADHRLGDLRKVRLRFDPAEVTAAALIQDVTRDHTVLDLSIAEPDLEDVIREIYGSRSVRPAT